MVLGGREFLNIGRRVVVACLAGNGTHIGTVPVPLLLLDHWRRPLINWCRIPRGSQLDAGTRSPSRNAVFARVPWVGVGRSFSHNWAAVVHSDLFRLCGSGPTVSD